MIGSGIIPDPNGALEASCRADIITSTNRFGDLVQTITDLAQGFDMPASASGKLPVLLPALDSSGMATGAFNVAYKSFPEAAAVIENAYLSIAIHPLDEVNLGDPDLLVSTTSVSAVQCEDAYYTPNVIVYRPSHPRRDVLHNVRTLLSNYCVPSVLAAHSISPNQPL